jgi:hypothetical protein
MKLISKISNRGQMPDSPSRIQKGPDEEHEYLKMHQTGATSYEHRGTFTVARDFQAQFGVKNLFAPNSLGMTNFPNS